MIIAFGVLLSLLGCWMELACPSPLGGLGVREKKPEVPSSTACPVEVPSWLGCRGQLFWLGFWMELACPSPLERLGVRGKTQDLSFATAGPVEVAAWLGS